MTTSNLASSVKEVLHRAKDIKDEDVALIDVLRLTEAMVGTMNPLFEMIDARVYSEFREIAEYISQMKEEITDLEPGEDRNESIPRAGLELDAIVQQTEEATNNIMEAAESILSADPSDGLAYSELVTEATMAIFEACSFQDITGQRISKVVNTLKHIENRVTKLSTVLGQVGKVDDVISAIPADDDASLKDMRPDADLLNGPSLAGEGIEQGDVDALFHGEVPTEASADSSAEAPEAPEAPEASEAPEALASGPALEGEGAGQDDIDAMFAGDEPSSESNDEPVAEAEAEAQPSDDGAKSQDAGQDDVDALFEADTVPEESSDETPAAKVAAAPPPPAAKVAASGAASDNSQQDIDALFD